MFGNGDIIISSENHQDDHDHLKTAHQEDHDHDVFDEGHHAEIFR